MSGSRRFVLFLFVACISCVVLVQVSLEGWDIRTSLSSYGLNAPQQPKGLEEPEVKEDAEVSKVGLKIESSSTPSTKITSPQILTTKAYQKPAYNKSTISHSIGTGQVRRLPIGKRPTKEVKETILVNRQERLQEILKSGVIRKSSVIRGRSSLDPMKSLRSMPIVNPDSVTKIIILTYFRAGSSFFGDLLQQNWKTFYHFEPLHSMTYDSRIGDDKIDQVFDLFNGIFNCNFTELNKYMHWVRQSYNQFLFSHNLFLRVTCHSNPKICFNATFVNAVCQRAPVHVVKLTRLHMHHLKMYLDENPNMKIKVVYLTRDPRGIVSSRWSLDWCNGTVCSNPNVLCNEMSDDLKVFDSLQKENPNNFIKIRYEDISLNPENESKKLFKFLQLPFSTTVQRFLKTHTVGRRTDDNNPYSTRRNTTAMAFTWRERFTFKQVIDVQSSCGDVLKTLNHSFITSPDQLPYPNGKSKHDITQSGKKVQQINKNPLYLKAQSLNKILPAEIVNDLKIHANNSEMKFLNNTNIEIHKTYNISEDSLRNNSRTIDYILVKQFKKK